MYTEVEFNKNRFFSPESFKNKILSQYPTTPEYFSDYF